MRNVDLPQPEGPINAVISPMHYQVAKDHGFTDVADFQILDEDGSMSLTVNASAIGLYSLPFIIIFAIREEPRLMSSTNASKTTLVAYACSV